MSEDDDKIFQLPSRIFDHPEYNPAQAGWLHVIGAPLRPDDESSDDAVLWCKNRRGWWLVTNNIVIRELSPYESYEADVAIGEQQPTERRWTVDVQAVLAELDLVPFDAPTSAQLDRPKLSKRAPARVIPWKRRGSG